MRAFEARVTQVVVVPKGEPIFSEQATEINIVAEGGGEFIEVKQYPDHEIAGTVRFDTDEWPIISEEIGKMVERCRDGEAG